MAAEKTGWSARLTRRRVLGLGLTAIAGGVLAACSIDRDKQAAVRTTDPQPDRTLTAQPLPQETATNQPLPHETFTAQPSLTPSPDPQAARYGRLTAQPTTVNTTPTPGVQPLGLVNERDTLLYIPPSYQPDRSAPFVLILHGAGGAAEHGLSLLQPLADAAGLILLAPASRRSTWDVIGGEFGPDITLIDAALAQTFSQCAIDRARLAIGGFSDGASYALSVGLTNGDLFTHTIAFSPGFMAPADLHGSPRLFVSHGTRDDVLPIDRCSRRIVPQVERAGYDVVYREFDGPHTVPEEIAREAIDWLLGQA